jgi:hypothetical protein
LQNRNSYSGSEAFRAGVMGIEEQKEEREVLGSIFPDEITGITLCGRPMTALS